MPVVSTLSGVGNVQSVDGEVKEAYEAYCKAETASDKHALLLKVVKMHPFVKERKPVYFKYLKHSVRVTGYVLDVWRFRKWLSSKAGREFKSKAGGMSDDGLYTVSPVLRELMPRGLHEVVFEQKEPKAGSVPATRMLFRGIPKFSGLSAQDEDEISNASAGIFFFDGKRLADAGAFYLTAKSNGENAKFSAALVDGTKYLISGSKTTCRVWPADDNVTDHFPNPKRELPADFISLVYSDWFLKLSRSDRDRFIKAMTERFGTVMAEINTPWNEHIVPINSLFVECYCALDRSGRPVHPKVSIDFFDSFGIRPFRDSIAAAPPLTRVTPSPEALEAQIRAEMKAAREEEGYRLDSKKFMGRIYSSVHNIKELDEVIAKVRDATNTEGAVLYITEAGTNAVIGLIKVKASEYVVRRRLRENFKSGMLRLLDKGGVKEFPPDSKQGGSKRTKPQPLKAILPKLEKRLVDKIKQLTHLPNCASKWKIWAGYSILFLRWWVKTRLLNGEDSKRVNLKCVLLEARCRLASLFQEFKTPTNESCIKATNETLRITESKREEALRKCRWPDVNEKKYINGPNPFMLLLSGAPGSGKSSFAKEIAKRVAEVIICCADDYFTKMNLTFSPQKLSEAHKWCQDKALTAMKKGLSVIIANTNTSYKEMFPYIAMKHFGKFPHEIHYELMPETNPQLLTYTTIHGVEKDKIGEMVRRLQNMAGPKNKNWPPTIENILKSGGFSERHQFSKFRNDKAIYMGVFFNPKTTKYLRDFMIELTNKPPLDEVKNLHVTTHFAPDKKTLEMFTPELNEIVPLKLTGYYSDDTIQCFVVETTDNIQVENENPHITIGTKVPPKVSNTALKYGAKNIIQINPPITIEGRLGVFL